MRTSFKQLKSNLKINLLISHTSPLCPVIPSSPPPPPPLFLFLLAGKKNSR